MSMPADRIKVFIVDDSAFMRRLLTAVLEQDPEIQVIGFARDGLEALEKIPRLKPQVVTMDVEMPDMDGLVTLERLLQLQTIPVIMVSSLTSEGAQATIRALELGAVDFVAKPASPADVKLIAGELIARIKAVAGLPGAKMRTGHAKGTVLPTPAAAAPAQAAAPSVVKNRPLKGLDVVAIGTSTGGPSALHTIMQGLPGDLPAGVLVVQHMPAGFTGPLARRLNEISRLSVKEAEDGDPVRPGHVLIGPAGWQMVVEQHRAEARVRLLASSPVETRFKPSADVLFLSVAQTYGPRALGVILTGMGNDGTRGLKAIRESDGYVLAEDESSCIVFGMPRSAMDAGVVHKMVPLSRMGAEITSLTLSSRQG